MDIPLTSLWSVCLTYSFSGIRSWQSCWTFSWVFSPKYFHLSFPLGRAGGKTVHPGSLESQEVKWAEESILTNKLYSQRNMHSPQPCPSGTAEQPAAGQTQGWASVLLLYSWVILGKSYINFLSLSFLISKWGQDNLFCRYLFIKLDNLC